MFNFIAIYSFIHVSGCVSRGTRTLLYPGPIMLLRRPWLSHICWQCTYINMGWFMLTRWKYWQ